MVIFLCRDDFYSIICGVYEAWMSKLGHNNVKLALKNTGNMEMFAEYREIEESDERFQKVIHAVRTKISEEAYKWIYHASLSCEEGKADIVYRFLIYGFHYGACVTKQIQIQQVYEVFKLNRAVSGENHLQLEFIRFAQMKDNILFSKIGPKNDVLNLLAPHFADRLNAENWIIYDVNRKKAAVYDPENSWLIVSVDNEEWQRRLSEETDENLYQNLWHAFFNSVAIAERTNYICQRGHLPLRFRPFMTEFKKQ